MDGQHLGAVQLLCNTSRGEGGVCQNMILYYTGGGGGKRKYDFLLCDVGRGGGRPNKILNDKGL